MPSGEKGQQGSSPARGASLGPPDGPHLPALSSAAEELIAAIGFEARHADSGRHIESLQDLTRPRIDSPQIALVTFPGAVPKLSVDPGDPGDEAVGLDGAKNRPGLGIDSDGSCGPDTGPPRACLRPRRARSRGRRRAPGSWRAPGRFSDRSSGCDPRRSETGAGRRRPFQHARRHRSSGASSPLAGSKAFSLSPEANQTCWPSYVTPCTLVDPRKGPVFANDFGRFSIHASILVTRQRSGE